MGKFVPQAWKPKDSDIEWAVKEFQIDRDEVNRQLELLRDHEFRRSYTDWNRVFRNWIRKSDEIGQLRREAIHRKPEQVTEDMLQDDRKRWEEDMRRLGVSVVGSATKTGS